MSRPRKIVFIKQGRWSYSNEGTREALLREFPDHQLVILDVANELFRRSFAGLLNRWHVWRHYGLDLLRGRRTFQQCFYRTAWACRTIGRWVMKRMREHLPDTDFTLQTQSLFDACQAGTPHFVFTDHTHLVNLWYPDFDARMLFPGRWIELEKRIYARAELNFTMARHVARSLVDHYNCPPERVRCVYAGSNAPVIPTDVNLGRYRRKRILFNGLFWGRKGGPELVAAFQQVLREHPDARLVILGCNPPVDVPNCEVLGRRPLEEVPRHYAESSVFCLPTRNEPFGIAVVEAMLHQMPVVATSIGALPDMVEEGVNGHLVPVGDVEGLAAALSRLLGSPETCARFGEASRRRALERFTWEAAGRRMAEGIRSALSARRE